MSDTQELNKEGLDAAIKAGRDAYRRDFCLEYIIEKSIQAWLSYTKATGFEELIAEVKAMAKETGCMQAEIDEQCRLLGMSGEREARHLAEIAELRGLLDEAEKAISVLAKLTAALAEKGGE